jgi:hypothetical protein
MDWAWMKYRSLQMTVSPSWRRALFGGSWPDFAEHGVGPLQSKWSWGIISTTEQICFVSREKINVILITFKDSFRTAQETLSLHHKNKQISWWCREKRSLFVPRSIQHPEISSVVTNVIAVHFSRARDIIHYRHTSLSSEQFRMLTGDPQHL